MLLGLLLLQFDLGFCFALSLCHSNNVCPTLCTSFDALLALVFQAPVSWAIRKQTIQPGSRIFAPNYSSRSIFCLAVLLFCSGVCGINLSVT